ncbi:MAG: hypothetical protein AAB092_05790, partial [Chloroflexota bacterium]
MNDRPAMMDTTPRQPWESGHPKPEGLRPWLILTTALVILAGVALMIFFPPIEGPRTGIPASRKVSSLTYPAVIVSEIVQPVGDQWLLPAAVARVGDATFVLDTGNNRILELDDSGHVLGTIGEALDENVHLQQPMAMATDGQRLFVANSLAGQVLVLSATGAVEQVIQLETAPGELTPANNRVVVAAEGVRENLRVLLVSCEPHAGERVWRNL